MSASWTLELIGFPVLRGAAGRTLRLEPRTAALLATLALRGPATRSELAAMLWPQAGAQAARGNLRQTLYRLRHSSEAELLVDDHELLRLSDRLKVDVDELQAELARGAWAAAGARAGKLLTGVELEDCPELRQWLEEERLKWDRLRIDACEMEATRLERVGQLRAALEWNGRVLSLDPAREQAYRREMVLLDLAGDRPAALRAYDRCRAALKRAFDAEPSLETTALAESLRGQTPPRSAGAVVRRGPPPLRPAPFVGREVAWGELESAWGSGAAAFVCGEAGAGKTRLLHEFVAARGLRTLVLQARPTDAAVPFSTHARLWRLLLSCEPDLRLPRWATAQLARFLPELGEPAPELEPLRLMEAQLELLRRTVHRVSVLVFDDLHYIDAQSFDSIGHLLGRLADLDAGHAQVPRLLCGLREAEAAPEVLARLDAMVERGLGARIRLTPLTVRDVGRLVGELGVAPANGLEPLAASLVRYTGGNPFFVLETLKTLREAADTGAGAVPDRLQTPGRVDTLLRARLDRIAPDVLQLARVLAVTEDDFSLGLASSLLEAPGPSLAASWEELVRAEIVRDRWFVHDLLYEVTLQTIPVPTRQWMHRRTAELLVEAGGRPARIGRHWFNAGEPERAASYLQRAMHELLLLHGSAVFPAVEERQPWRRLS